MKGLHKIRQKWTDSKLGRNDISVRIYLSFVVVLAVSLLLTGAIFNYLYQRNYTRSYTELLTKQGKKIARRVSKFQYKKNIGQYEKYSVYIDEIESAENTDVWILSNHKAKNALKEDFTNAEMNDDNLTDEMYAVLRQAFGGQTGASSSYDKAYGMMILRVAIPVHDYKTDQVIGAVMMVSMIDRQTMGLREGKYLISLSAVVAVVISYLIALIFTKYLSLPINKIGKTIRRIAGGDYSPVEKYSHSRQLSQLEEQLDVLAERLTKAEQERANLEQVRRDFFANVSHELRTPITVVRGYAEMLHDDVLSEEEDVRGVYDRILLECQGMERLVQDLFLLSKMQNPDFQMDKEPVSLAQIFADVMRSARVIGEEKEIHFVVDIPEEQPFMIEGDYGRLRQMFLIVLDNAVKFSERGGKVHLTLVSRDGLIKAQIADQGIGIAPEELPYIFEKFYKSKLTQNEKGTGLGLMIAKQIILRHGGDVEVQSVPGEGTTFTFTFMELTSLEEYE